MCDFDKIKLHPTKIKAMLEEMYSIADILYDFCKNNGDVEEINKIIPLVKILSAKTDELNAYFIDKH